ncbi:hypothetical protein BAZOLSSOX_2381 [uncultured Gammaproteobacteria bacterium]|nr:hypothetical protein BAZOLSSOX_2381 [uncultured Gammaproteobacteria bacterium]
MLYYSCFFSFLGIIKYEGLHNLVYRVDSIVFGFSGNRLSYKMLVLM